MEINKKSLLKLHDAETTITATAKKYCEENNIEYSDSIRRKCSNIINSEKDDDLENITVTETPQYNNDSFMPSAWSPEKNRFLSIEEYCEVYGLDSNTVKSSKLVSHNASHMTYNIAFFSPEEEAVSDIQPYIEEVVKKHIQPVETTVYTRGDENWVDRLVYTDTHIAMEPNSKDGDPLYDGKWDKEEIFSRLSIMIEETVINKKGSVLYIDELGDFLDGLDGKTTRKGHDLPQNMNNKVAFETGIEFKVKLVEDLLPHYDKIICRSVTNDNHAGIFSYFLNTAVKGILENKYPDRVQYKLIKRFIDHYKVGNHTFILCHGKDHLENKSGNKPVLDSKTYQKVDQYCKEYSLYDSNTIEYSFGDCHQQIHDYTTSNEFEYKSYPAFSPPSNWVKLNFKLTKSGFNNYNIDKDSHKKVLIPYFFKKQ